MGLDMYFYKGKKLFEDEVRAFNVFSEMVHAKHSEIVSEINSDDIDYNEVYKQSREFALKNMENDNIMEIIEIIENLDEVQYFRKHSDLHGYLAVRYGYQADNEDNCVYYVLDREDLEDILNLANKALSDGDVEHYEGFFWGESTEEDWKETVEFIQDLLDSGYFNDEKESIYYSAWY